MWTGSSSGGRHRSSYAHAGGRKWTVVSGGRGGGLARLSTIWPRAIWLATFGLVVACTGGGDGAADLDGVALQDLQLAGIDSGTPEAGDVQPADIKQASGGVCAGPENAPWCPLAGTQFFPTFSKACTKSSDCFVAVHQGDCCTKYALGLSVAVAADFDAAESRCQPTHWGVGCLCMQTEIEPVAEDGYHSNALNDFGVKCDMGTCRTFMYTEPKHGCGGGLSNPAPVKECSQDSDCAVTTAMVDSCGTLVETGIAVFAKAAYEAQPKCPANQTCAPKPTTTDDGQPVTASPIQVRCFCGYCTTGKPQ